MFFMDFYRFRDGLHVSYTVFSRNICQIMLKKCLFWGDKSSTLYNLRLYVGICWARLLPYHFIVVRKSWDFYIFSRSWAYPNCLLSSSISCLLRTAPVGISLLKRCLFGCPADMCLRIALHSKLVISNHNSPLRIICSPNQRFFNFVKSKKRNTFRPYLTFFRPKTQRLPTYPTYPTFLLLLLLIEKREE